MTLTPTRMPMTLTTVSVSNQTGTGNSTGECVNGPLPSIPVAMLRRS